MFIDMASGLRSRCWNMELFQDNSSVIPKNGLFLVSQHIPITQEKLLIHPPPKIYLWFSPRGRKKRAVTSPQWETPQGNYQALCLLIRTTAFLCPWGHRRAWLIHTNTGNSTISIAVRWSVVIMLLFRLKTMVLLPKWQKQRVSSQVVKFPIQDKSHQILHGLTSQKT